MPEQLPFLFSLKKAVLLILRESPWSRRYVGVKKLLRSNFLTPTFSPYHGSSQRAALLCSG